MRLKLGKKQKEISVKPGELELRRGELPPPKVPKKKGWRFIVVKPQEAADDSCPSAMCKPATGPYYL